MWKSFRLVQSGEPYFLMFRVDHGRQAGMWPSNMMTILHAVHSTQRDHWEGQHTAVMWGSNQEHPTHPRSGPSISPPRPRSQHHDETHVFVLCEGKWESLLPGSVRCATGAITDTHDRSVTTSWGAGWCAGSRQTQHDGWMGRVDREHAGTLDAMGGRGGEETRVRAAVMTAQVLLGARPESKEAGF